MSTALRYCLLQIPGTLAVAAALYLANRSDWISSGTALLVLVGWLAKDALLYPVTRDAYGDTPSRFGDLTDKLATVRQPLSPRGSVELDGAIWQAEYTPAGRVAQRGDRVRIVGVRGLLLIVGDPEDGGDAEDGNEDA